MIGRIAAAEAAVDEHAFGRDGSRAIGLKMIKDGSAVREDDYFVLKTGNSQK